MSTDNVIPIKPESESVADRLQQLDFDILLCRQTLDTAVAALCKAEDGRFEEESADLAGSAIRVLERCSRDLSAIEERVDCLGTEVSHAVRAQP